MSTDFDYLYHDELRAILLESATRGELIIELQRDPAVWEAVLNYVVHNWDEPDDYNASVGEIVDELTSCGDKALDKALYSRYAGRIRRELDDNERMTADDRAYGNHS